MTTAELRTLADAVDRGEAVISLVSEEIRHAYDLPDGRTVSASTLVIHLRPIAGKERL